MLSSATKRTKFTGAAAAAVLIASAGVGSTAIASGRPQTATRGRAARTVTMRLTSQLEQAHLADTAPAGRSPGDVLVLTERVQDAHGRQVATDAASCVALFDERSLCGGVYVFAQGQITIQLLQPNLSGTRTFTEVITGGTGSYVGATGTVTDNQGPSSDRLTFHLRLP